MSTFLLVMLLLGCTLCLAAAVTFIVMLTTFDMVFYDSRPSILPSSKETEETVEPLEETVEPLEPLCPRLIHQTWKTTELLPYQQVSQASVRRFYPDYEYKLWTDADIEAFALTHFPAFHADTWQRLKPFIRKVDCVRYMWLYVLGGMYVDIDMNIKKNAGHLWENSPGTAFVPTRHSVVNWTENTDAASPAFLFSWPGHPLWLRMLDYIKQHHTAEYIEMHPHEETIVATGPVAMSNVLREQSSTVSPLTFLSESRFGIGPFKNVMAKYSIHLNNHNQTWRAKGAV